MEAKGLIEKIKVIQKDTDYRKLKFRDGSNTDYDFIGYKLLKELFIELLYKKMSIDNAERKQDQFNAIIDVLKDGSKPRVDKYIDLKDKFLKNVKKITRGEKKLLRGLKLKFFVLI